VIFASEILGFFLLGLGFGYETKSVISCRDSGETRLMRPGDLTVQRATMHQWRNPSETKWSRMVAILSEIEPVVVGNQTLDAKMP